VKLAARAAALAAALAAAACAGGFTRRAPDALVLGQTTPAQALERFGRPTGRDRMVRFGKPIDVLSYAYTTEAERHHGDEGVIASRNLMLSFHEDRLVGYEYRSSIEADHTDFDARKARELVKGRSTRDEVAKLLGRPSGHLVFPMIEASLGEAMVYTYVQQRRVPFGAPITFTKSLVITFDQGGALNATYYQVDGIP